MTQIQTKFKQTEIGLIPEDWEVVELGKLIHEIIDNRGRNPEYYVENGIPVIDNFMITGSKNIDLTLAKRYLDDKVYNDFIRKYNEEGDILMTLVGNGYGNVGLSRDEKSIIIQNTIGIRVNYETSNIFLLYFLIHNRKNITDMNRGAAQPSVKVGDVKKLKISFPPLPEQKAISEILSSLDDKIELLEKQNKTLENIGQALFKSWFVDFEPFKNDLVESEMGMIPRGWKVGKVKDFGDIICGKTPSKSDNENFGGEIPFIKIPDMHGKMFILNTEDSLTEKGVNSQKNKTIPKGSLVVSCIATVGLVSIITKDSQTNQQINSIIPNNEESLYFLYFQISNMYDYLQQMGSAGSATLNINTTSFSNIEIIIPSEKVLKEFHLLVSDYFEKIKENNLQIQTLSNLRDSLLPRLMSGKIRVV